MTLAWKILKKNEDNPLPEDARLIIDPEPFGLGIQRLFVAIESDDEDFVSTPALQEMIQSHIKKKINEDDRDLFKTIDEAEAEPSSKHKQFNWLNIGINLLAIAVVIIFSLLFPPSLLLTLGLTLLSFLATAYTARKYLIDFFRNIRQKKFATMSTTISLGWFLSLAHTLFHIAMMPLATSFSMIFMGFVMPILLITCINGMDEIKRIIMDKSQKMQLKGMQSLFPQMAASYQCYSISREAQQTLSPTINALLRHREQREQREQKGCEQKEPPEYDGESKTDKDADYPKAEAEILLSIQGLLQKTKTYQEQKNLLKEGMFIQVNALECFPTDCVLIDNYASIDASLLTGEPHQSKRRWQKIPAGAINLGQTVTVYATHNLYYSTIHGLLFGANRKKDRGPKAPVVPKFAYFYTALIIIAMLAAILLPLGLGVITIPLVLQNVIGILFSVCPCTIAIAHQLPKLISLHHRGKKGIHLHDEDLLDAQLDNLHTIFVDKTGTLTTAQSEVASSNIPINAPVWERIYLLEKQYGQGHPLARAIQTHFETKKKQPSFNEVLEPEPNEGNGLSAYVQGNHLQIGSYDYIKNQMRNRDLVIPIANPLLLSQGLSVSYVVEDGQFIGLIYFQHQLREGVKEALQRFKKDGKRIIMLTGDNEASAQGLNKKMGSVFTTIYAGKKPHQKEEIIDEIMKEEQKKPHPCPEGVWFIGDGVNDGPALRKISQLGGISCAMNANDKAAFFADLSLDGSFNTYLYEHYRLNRSLITHTRQNQGILTYSTLAFLAFIISFSIVGLGVSPLIPMGLMVCTTLFILFNSYRTQLSIDVALDKACSRSKKLLASNLSIGLLLAASTLIIVSTIAATIATGGLALPVVAFAAGTVLAFSSACSLTAIGVLAAFGLLVTTSFLCKSDKSHALDSHLSLAMQAEVEVGEVNAEVCKPSYGPLFQKMPSGDRFYGVDPGLAGIEP